MSEGEQIEVEIEDRGEQGDGIARLGPDYIVFVPVRSRHPDWRLRHVEITETRDNFAFAEVIKEESIA